MAHTTRQKDLEVLQLGRPLAAIWAAFQGSLSALLRRKRSAQTQKTEHIQEYRKSWKRRGRGNPGKYIISGILCRFFCVLLGPFIFKKWAYELAALSVGCRPGRAGGKILSPKTLESGSGASPPLSPRGPAMDDGTVGYKSRPRRAPPPRRCA